MRLRHVLAAATLVLATFSAHADVKPAPNPCGLLTEQEASAILGAPLKFGMKMDGSGMCMFIDAKGSPAIILQGSVYSDQSGANDEITSMAKITPPNMLEVVSGIGDHAELIANSQGDRILIVQKGTRTVKLSLMHTAGPNLAAHKVALEQAGKQVAARL